MLPRSAWHGGGHTILAVLLVASVVRFASAGDSCHAYTDCGPREECYGGTCGCLIKLGLQGAPACRERSPGTDFLIVWMTMSGIFHFATACLELMSLWDYLHNKHASLWDILTSYKFLFLFLSAVYNLYPVVSRIVFYIMIFSDLDIHHYYSSPTSVITWVSDMGILALISSFMVVAKIFIQTAAELGDPLIVGLSNSSSTLALTVLLAPLVILFILIINVLFVQKIMLRTVAFLTSTFIISIVFGYSAKAVIDGLHNKLAKMPTPRSPHHYQQDPDSDYDEDEPADEMRNNRSWYRRYRRDFKKLSTIIECSHEDQSTINFQNVSCQSLLNKSSKDLISPLNPEGPQQATSFEEEGGAPPITISKNTNAEPKEDHELPFEQHLRPIQSYKPTFEPPVIIYKHGRPRHMPKLPVADNSTISTFSSPRIGSDGGGSSSEVLSGRAAAIGQMCTLLAFRVTVCTVFTSLVSVLNFIIPWGSTDPWKGIAGQILVQIGNTSLMIANLFCLYLMSKVAKDYLDRLLSVMPSWPPPRPISSRKIHASLT